MNKKWFGDNEESLNMTRDEMNDFFLSSDHAFHFHVLVKST